MTRHTQAEALKAFGMLRDADAGRLRGHAFKYTPCGRNPAITAGTLHEQDAAVLHACVNYTPGEPVTADMIVYVVVCDGTPVAWLTRNAKVVTPAAQLTDYQVKQQARAVDALSRLPLPTLRALVRWTNQEERRAAGVLPDEPGRHVQVADPAAPTLTWWTRIDGDPHASRQRLRDITGCRGDVLIVDAAGYGDYRHSTVLDLDVLCTIEQIAAQGDAPGDVVGTWFHTADPGRPPQTGAEAVDAFCANYAGIHSGQLAFAAAERDARGWTSILESAGIGLSLFDLHEFARRLFATEAYAVALHNRRIAVFRILGDRPEAGR